MHLDTLLLQPPSHAAAHARHLRDLGFEGLYTFEGNRDVFTPLVLAADATDAFCYTNVAIAFPRNPMHLAYQAWDLQELTGGRFALGLGTQIRPHIVNRFGERWERPLAQMRETIEAIAAIFSCWHEGTPLDYRGEFRHHTLMTPTFVPPPLASGPPPVWVGALGPKMTALVAELADGLCVHPFNTQRFVTEHVLANVDRGLARAGRTRDDLTLVLDAVCCVYGDEAEEERARRAARYNLAFYASTPAYRVTLDCHGWGDLQPELNALSKQGRWDDMAAAIDDEILATIALVGTPAEVADEIERRFGGVADRLAVSFPGDPGDATLAELVERVLSHQ